MRTMTYSKLRAKYATVALNDDESLKETAYLLRNPDNARRLLTSTDRLEHEGGTVRELAE